ncbi:MAG: MGMT family protein [Abditibacteriaceae bacterium]
MNRFNEDPTHDELRIQIHQLVRQIPKGKVTNYGSIGAACKPPINGYICGRLMQNAPPDVCWWRVVAKEGSLPAAKRSPELGHEQRDLLEEEGVEFEENGKVMQKCFCNLLECGSLLPPF